MDSSFPSVSFAIRGDAARRRPVKRSCATMSEMLYDCGDRQSGTSLLGARGDLRRRIVARLQEHPEGLMPAARRTWLGVDKSLADTRLSMLCYITGCEHLSDR